MSYTVDVELNGSAITGLTLEGAQIRFGRRNAYDQPEPTTASVRLVRDSTLGTVNVNDVAIGSTLRIAVTPSGQAEQRRFYGIVTDVNADYETVNIAATATGIYSMRQLTYVVEQLGGVGQQLEGNAADVLGWAYIDALEPFIPDVNNKPARFPDLYATASGFPTISYFLEELDRIDVGRFMEDAAAASRGGVIFENMLEVASKDNVAVTISNYVDRSDLIADLTLSSSEIVRTDWKAARELGSYSTAQTIEYVGPFDPFTYDYPNPGEATAESDLIETFGPFTNTQSLPMTDATEAATLAAFRINCTEWPGWLLDVTIPMGTLSDARAAAICQQARVSRCWHTPSIATGLPTIYFLEGYTETIRRNDWQLRVRLTDAGSSGVGQTWNAVTALLTWNNVDATTRWVDLKNEAI